MNGYILFEVGTGRFYTVDAKGYTYKFYDQTGTEFTVTNSNTITYSGSDLGMSDDIPVYATQYEVTPPDGAEVLYVVATAPESEPAPVYMLRGTFNKWGTDDVMTAAEGSTVVSITKELAAGEYTFKINEGDNWYGNGGKITDTTTTTSTSGWLFETTAGDCTLKATGGTYTFNFDTATNKLIVLAELTPRYTSACRRNPQV